VEKKDQGYGQEERESGGLEGEGRGGEEVAGEARPRREKEDGNGVYVTGWE
jgi:hypothetical protein